MNVLIFSEEYEKTTKGMFVVWMNHASEAAKRNHVDILLNQEHWAFNEAADVFQHNDQVALHRLSFAMPSTIVKRVFEAGNNVWLLRALRFVVGKILNVALSPGIILYLIVRLRQLQPDAIYSHNGGWPAGQLCRWIMLAAMLARIPKRIFIVHNYPEKYFPLILFPVLALFRFLQARLIDICATSIVTVSDSVKTTLDADVFKRRVLRIHNGIQLSPPPIGSTSSTPPLAWHPSGLTVGFVGGLYPLKGPHVLLDAFKFVHLTCELALLGPADPSYLETLKKRALLCPNKVSFLGFHQDVDSFMQKIDFLVVPSIAFESFGMVILEAMKHRKPVICTDFGGMKEVVDNGVTGLVVPAGDDAALAKAITILLEDTELRLRMGEAGYRRLNELFTAEKMETQYNALLS